jgi:hypothetical protein
MAMQSRTIEVAGPDGIELAQMMECQCGEADFRVFTLESFEIGGMYGLTYDCIHCGNSYCKMSHSPR